MRTKRVTIAIMKNARCWFSGNPRGFKFEGFPLIFFNDQENMAPNAYGAMELKRKSNVSFKKTLPVS